MTQSVLRGPDGRYLVSHLMGGRPAIAIYDSAGGWMGLYDREGNGPGEFHYTPRLLPGPAGSIYAAEEYRLVAFDAEMNVLSTTRTDLRTDLASVATMPSGEIVVANQFTTDGGVPYTVVLLGPDGSLLEPVQRADSLPDSGLIPGTVVAPSASGGFWTLSVGGLRLREYSAQGELRSTLTIRSDWFDPWEERIEGEGWDTPPRPYHMGILDPGDGVLILVTAVADPEWQPRGNTIDVTKVDFSRDWDSVVQLVDARSGEVFADQRFDEFLLPVRGASDLLRSVHLDEFGHVETQIWKVTGPS